MADVEQLADLLADLDRDPDGYTTNGTVAAMIRAAWGPDAPADPDAWEPCECGCNEAAECPCDEPAPAEETEGHKFTVTSGHGGTGWHCATCVWTGVDVGSEAAARREHARVAADITSGRLVPAPAEETDR